MFCTKCGAQIPEGANYCAQCGTPVVKEAAPGAAQPVQHTSGMAIASLVCGLAGFLFAPSSILAIIFGALALSHTNKIPELKGRDMAIVGLALGIVTLIGWAVLAIWIVSVIWGLFVV